MKKTYLYCAAGLFGLCFGYSQILAADPMGAKPILDREFKGLTAKGFKLGMFTVLPSLDTGIDYTSNVLQSNTNVNSDKVLRTDLGVKAISKNNNRKIVMDLSGSNLDYDENDNYDRIHFKGYAGLNYKLSSNFNVEIGGRYNRSSQTRYDTALIGSSFDPIRIDDYGVGGKLQFQSGMMRWDLKGDYKDVSYKDTDIIGGGRLVQSDRDHSVYEVGVDVAVGNTKSTNIKPIIGVTIRETDFDKRDYQVGTNDFSGVDQSNTQYDITAGVELNPDGQLRGHARAGYGVYDSGDGELDKRQTAIFDIDLTYLYTPLTNLQFNIDRFFNNDTDATGGTIETRLSANIIHELTRRWIFDTGVSYAHRSFDSNGSDTTWEAGAGVTHRLNDRFAINGDVRYISRESDQSNGDYDEARAMIRLKSKF